MMRLGFVMLCHTALDRAAQVARFWSQSGCPVVIHVDKKISTAEVDLFKSSLEDLANIRFSTRHKCEWGGWGIVAATQDASKLLLEQFPDINHVFLASGSCLPLRHADDLSDYLSERPNTDFIQSVTTADVGWTIGGLNSERFSFYFPFSWRRQRALFDYSVRLQRKLNVSRVIPAGIHPHLGSQWWCLTRETLSKIIYGERRAEFDRYFKSVWIPDESYFQTLARSFSKNIDSRSLTLSKFDYQGKPHVFYDDHLQLLRKSDCFVARKIWPNADKLYTKFLRQPRISGGNFDPAPGKIDRLFSKAAERRTRGRHGLYMQSRFPIEGYHSIETAAPYSIFEGFSELFENFEGWLAKVAPVRVHGHLFARERVEFSGGLTSFAGGLSDSASLRDYNPKSFLTNLIWNTRGERQCFQFSPNDNSDIIPFILKDPNARLSLISGAFALSLFRNFDDFGALRVEVARLQRIETDLVNMMRSPAVKAKVRIWSLSEFIENPAEFLQIIVDDFGSRERRLLTEFPRFVDFSGFGTFLQELRNQGMQPVLMGDFPSAVPHVISASKRNKIY